MYYFIIILVAIIFYLIIPVLGFFFGNRNQQRFIERTTKSRFYPLCPDHFIHDDIFETPQDNTSIRFFGKITAWDTSHMMILENQGLQVKVQLKQGHIMTLVPSPDKKNFASYRLKTLDLQNIGAVNVHTNVFVCGLIQKTELPNRQEMITFVESEQNPLTVVLFEGDHGQFFARLLMAAAHFQSDSAVVIPSVMAGFFCLLLVFTAMVQTVVPHAYALTAAVALLSIFSLVLPPGGICWIPARMFIIKFSESRRFSTYLNALLYGLVPTSDRTLAKLDSQCDRFSASMPSGGTYVACNSVSSNEIPIPLPPEIDPEGRSQWTLFGEECGDGLKSADDPFFPYAVIPSNPKRLLSQIAQKSQRWKMLATLFIVAGTVSNLYILAKLFWWLA